MTRKKEYKCSLSLGASQNEKDGATLAINMINKNGINEKRNGHINIAELTDVNLNPLRINGIYSYKDTSQQESKIVHAGNKIFRCNSDFTNPTEIPKPSILTIQDEKSMAIMLGNDLFIAGCGELLLYDGQRLKGAYENELAYIPLTSYGVTDQASGAFRTKGEGANLFTKKRRNSLRGSNCFRENGRANMFILDSNIEYGTKFVLEAKIRTRTSEEEISSNTTSYIGIDTTTEEEVSRVVTIRCEKSMINGKNEFFVSEPIRDDEGNIINLKINDKVYTYDMLPFGVSVKNKNELRLSFEAVTPVVGEDNIIVEYEAQIEEEMIKHTSLLSLSNSENGKELLLASFGDNKIYFTDKKNGIFHMPRDNQISFGNDGEPITAIVRLSDNLIGVFKKNSFYRVRFTSSNDKGYEIFLSSDSVGAYNQASSCVVNYDCLVFNRDGVFGVNDYKSTSNIFDALRSRSFKINSFLMEHTGQEKENAKALVLDKRYYLFVGESVYIADTRYKVKGTGNDNFGYEWWLWQGVLARCVYTDGVDVYFGTENGQIRKFIPQYCDIEKYVYKTEEASLLCNQESTYTEFVLPDSFNSTEDMIANLSMHKRLIKASVTYKNGAFAFDKDSLIYSDGTLRVNANTYYAIYMDGTYLTDVLVTDIDMYSYTVETNKSLQNDKVYDIYVYMANYKEYQVVEKNGAYLLLEKGEPIKLLDTEGVTLTLTKKVNFECQYVTSPLCFDLPTKKKTLKRLLLKIPKWADGKIEVEIRTKDVIKKREITLGKSFAFSTLDFENLSFNGELDMLVPARCLIRDFDYLVLKIISHDGAPFGIDTAFFEYTTQD